MDSWSNLMWLIALSSARIYGAMTVCPIFSGSQVPRLIKVILSICFSIYIAPHSYANNMLDNYGIFFKLFLLSKEVVVGFVFGYVFSFPIWVVENVGNLIDLQRGEQFGATVNQTTKNPSSSISKLLIQGFMVYLLMANGILFFLKLIFKSFILIPSDSFSFHYLATKNTIIGLFSDYFYWMVILALPVIFLMFILEVSLGLLSSFIQQLNVTTLAMPLKSALSLFILVFYIGVIYHVAISQFMSVLYTKIITV